MPFLLPLITLPERRRSRKEKGRQEEEEGLKFDEEHHSMQDTQFATEKKISATF